MAAQLFRSRHAPALPDRGWPIPAAVRNAFWRRFWSGVLLLVIMLAAASVARPAFGIDSLPLL